MNLTNTFDIEIADTPEAMVEKICLLLQNDQHWENISAAGKQSAEHIFGIEHARKVLTDILVCSRNREFVNEHTKNTAEESQIFNREDCQFV